jgi:aspartate/methionine/tyrosine aminotransferase
MMGLPELRNAIAVHYKHHQALDLDPEQEVMVTSGATEAIAGAIFALVEPGDEVVLFQPMYDAYLPLVLRAGGVPKFVTLKPPHWRLEEDDLARAFSPRTKVVVFNNPLNPAGTVYDHAQIQLLASFCEKSGAIVISDEVWEHVIYDDRKHISILNFPALRQRGVKIGSAGKIFSLTGWKVGLVAAAPEFMRVLAKAHQFLTFTTPPNLQTAVAYGLLKDDEYFRSMRAELQRSRDLFTRGLAERGLTVLESAGTYFVNVDIAPLGDLGDVQFCRELALETGVVAIPVSAFYAQEAVTNVIRFCFAKRDATLQEALAKLENLARKSG